MNVQATSKSERERYGKHAVRIVCSKVVAPETDTMARVQKAMPFEAKIATAAPDNGYGRTVYVLCGSEDQKRKAELAVEGKQGTAERIDALRRWVALHSHIYYNLGQTVVPDEAWDRKAEKLARVQDVHDSGTWKNDAFRGFTGDTGYHLPVTSEIRDQAQKLVEKNNEDSGSS